MGAPIPKVATTPEEGLEGVRLSPVELRNLSLINDPALAGLHREGFSASAYICAPTETSPVCKEADPTLLARVEADIVEVSAQIEHVKAGPEGPLAHERVVVDPDNPYFSTDGMAIYSKDGSALICMVVPCEEYEVLPGCTRIADRAFDTAEMLARIRLPQGLRSIGRLAFAKSGIVSVDIPDSLEHIGEKAFFCCKNLIACILSAGVKRIEDSAFAYSKVERMRIPASLEHLGVDVFDSTPASKSAHTGTISVDPCNPIYRIDSHGGLYRNGAFASLLSCIEAYCVEGGCKEVLPQACRRNTHIKEIVLPEGLEAIGDDAFHGCQKLGTMHLPSTLRSIGDRAFMDTRIMHLDLSKSLECIGEGALLVGGENPVRPHKPLHSIELDPQNARFYMQNGLLCERGAGDAGADKVLVYVGPQSIVRIPDTVNRIAPYAFLGATDIDELYVHEHLHSICAGAFSVARSIPKIHVRLLDIDADEPYEVELPVPSLSYRYKNFSDLFTTYDGRTVLLFAYYDAWVTNTKDVGEFASAALVRLSDPIRMRQDMKELYLGILDRKQAAVCAHFASRGDLDALQDLDRWGVLSSDTVADVLNTASSASDTQAVGCLLELKRRMGRFSGLDLTI